MSGVELYEGDLWEEILCYSHRLAPQKNFQYDTKDKMAKVYRSSDPQPHLEDLKQPHNSYWLAHSPKWVCISPAFYF